MHLLIDGPNFSGKKTYAKWLQTNSMEFKNKTLFVGCEFANEIMKPDNDDVFIYAVSSGLVHQQLSCEHHELDPFIKWDTNRSFAFFLKAAYEGIYSICLIPPTNIVKQRYLRWVPNQKKIYTSLSAILEDYYKFISRMEAIQKWIPSNMILESTFDNHEIKKRVRNQILHRRHFLKELNAPRGTWGNIHSDKIILIIIKDNKGNRNFVHSDEIHDLSSEFLLKTLAKLENYRQFVLTPLYDRGTGTRNNIQQLVNRLKPMKIIAIGSDTMIELSKIGVQCSIVSDPNFYKRLNFSEDCVNNYVNEFKGVLWNVQ